MARIYQFPENSDNTADIEGSELSAFDPVTRKALLKFWISAPSIIVAAILLYLLTRGQINPTLAITAALFVAVAIIILLFIMNRSLLSMRVITPEEATIDLFLDRVVSQLDDRFSIFHGVQVNDDHVAEHIIVGPTGIYAVKSSATLDSDGWARSGDIEQLLSERQAVDDLVEELVSQRTMNVVAVLCVPQGTTVRVEQENQNVWIVPSDKLAVALIKRSTAEGAIGQNVNETGAFSSDNMQSAAIERALANHWNIPTRRNRTDYTPPPDLTGEGAAG